MFEIKKQARRVAVVATVTALTVAVYASSAQAVVHDLVRPGR